MNGKSVAAADRLAQDTARRELVDAVGEQLAALLVAARAVTAAAASDFHPDLAPAAFHVARWLGSFGPARVGQVAQGVGMDKSAVSRLLADLRRAKLVRVQPDPTDRRAVVLALTPTGARHLAAALGRKGLLFRERFEAWDNADLATLADLLRRLNR